MIGEFGVDEYGQALFVLMQNSLRIVFRGKSVEILVQGLKEGFLLIWQMDAEIFDVTCCHCKFH